MAIGFTCFVLRNGWYPEFRKDIGPVSINRACGGHIESKFKEKARHLQSNIKKEKGTNDEQTDPRYAGTIPRSLRSLPLFGFRSPPQGRLTSVSSMGKFVRLRTRVPYFSWFSHASKIAAYNCENYCYFPAMGLIHSVTHKDINHI